MTAAYMNDHFVNIKVDREERPDVDAVYMEAVQAATGQGGWPMTVFLTRRRRTLLLRHLLPARAPPRHALLPAGPGRRAAPPGPTGARRSPRSPGRSCGTWPGGSWTTGTPSRPGEEELAQALLGLTRDYDATHGGFGGAPKFPPSMVIEFLLRHHARTGSEGALQMAADTCEAMARGGIYDQLGGGFARYSVDREWVVPHFEKMLYDNALLCRVYAHLWRATGSDLARRVALETADFMVRELRTNEGGFASALDADSEDARAASTSRARTTSGPRRSCARSSARRTRGWPPRYFGVTEEGTFEEGASVLQLPQDGAGGGRRRGSRRRHGTGCSRARGRAARARPGRQGGRRLERPRDRRARGGAGRTSSGPTWSSAATAAADLLVRLHMDAAARLARTSQGRPGRRQRRGPGGLRATSPRASSRWPPSPARECGWSSRGSSWTSSWTSSPAEDGALYDTAHDAEQLIRRPQDPTDNATPSGWTAAAGALLSYAAQTGAEPHRTAAERALGVVRALGPRAPRFIGHGLAVAEALLDGPREVAVVGPAQDPARGPAPDGAARLTAPGAVVAVGEPWGGRAAVAGRPAAGRRCPGSVRMPKFHL